MNEKPETLPERIERLRRTAAAIAQEAMNRPELGDMLDRITAQLVSLERALPAHKATD